MCLCVMDMSTHNDTTHTAERPSLGRRRVLRRRRDRPSRRTRALSRPCVVKGVLRVNLVVALPLGGLGGVAIACLALSSARPLTPGIARAPPALIHQSPEVSLDRSMRGSVPWERDGLERKGEAWQGHVQPHLRHRDQGDLSAFEIFSPTWWRQRAEVRAAVSGPIVAGCMGGWVACV